MDTENKDLKAGIVQVDTWRQFEWLRHGFSTRKGGVSTAYGKDSLNLGWTKEDDPALVAENRRRFFAGLQVSHDKPWLQTVTLKQVHSGMVCSIRKGSGVLEGKLQAENGGAMLEGDGLVTNLPGVVLAIQTADCVPVLVVDVEKRLVAALHAGWRGTVARIVEQGIGTIRREYGSRPEDLMAAVGPSIGSCCYAVGEEVRSEFGSQFGYADELFTTAAGQTRLDLWEANRRQLLDAGVQAERITVVGECTACSVMRDARKYFSHRAEHGFTGRMISAVGIVAGQ